ncbi:hypothetical protein DPMN_000756 [Dreissena polymorpha]|uniref:Uncharacterized protein n=1 Tax=Dreissena polymorpha TaxID=45954 RepID=A0A9D4MIV6_DREPO|nr:hypothetical protein DPMN_000756 [Dreissena polymorpha]
MRTIPNSSYGPMSLISRIDGFHNTYDSFSGQVKFDDVSAFQKFAARIRAFGDQVLLMLLYFFPIAKPPMKSPHNLYLYSPTTKSDND